MRSTSDGSLRPEFYAPHRERALAGRPPFFLPPEAAPAAGTQHRHALRARTNLHGEAGFIFKPSSAGGDRYKLRAYLGAPTLPSDGTDAKAVMVETGTLVVWRRIRIAKYLVWDYPAGFVQPPAPVTKYFTGEALSFVIFQAPFGDSLTYSCAVPASYRNGFLTSSGNATSFRACHVWWGTPFLKLVLLRPRSQYGSRDRPLPLLPTPLDSQ